MKMQRFTEWLAQMLDALPWRRGRRQARRNLHARAFSQRQALFPDPNTNRWQAPELPRRTSTRPTEPTTLLKTPMPTPEPPPTSTSLVPVAPPPTNVPPSQAEAAAESANAQLAAERRLVFTRYLVRRGTFNEGFSSETLPAQYQPSQDE